MESVKVLNKPSKEALQFATSVSASADELLSMALETGDLILKNAYLRDAVTLSSLARDIAYGKKEDVQMSLINVDAAVYELIPADVLAYLGVSNTSEVEDAVVRDESPEDEEMFVDTADEDVA